jgi:hypothetical protein
MVLRDNRATKCSTAFSRIKKMDAKTHQKNGRKNVETVFSDFLQTSEAGSLDLVVKSLSNKFDG